MSTKRLFFVLIAVAVLVVAACAPQGGPASTATLAPEATPPQASAPTTTPPSVEAIAEPTASAEGPSIPGASSKPAERPVCPNPHGGVCLGDLKAGTYTTARFKPDITYTVPEGWTNGEDLVGNFLLQRIADFVETDVSTGPYIGVHRNIAAPDACVERPDPDVGQSVNDLVAWFLANQQLTVTEPQLVTIGGLEGVYIDVAKAADAPGCSWELEFKYGKFAPLIIGGGLSELYHVSISPDWQERLYLLPDGFGGNVVIELGPEGQSLSEYLSMVEPVLATFNFGTGE